MDTRRTENHAASSLKGLARYIVTIETSRRRYFVFLQHDILPDNMLVNIALDNAYYLGVLSSRVHVSWALAAGGRLGIGNDPRYNKTRCFETFPFPNANEAQKAPSVLLPKNSTRTASASRPSTPSSR